MHTSAPLVTGMPPASAGNQNTGVSYTGSRLKCATAATGIGRWVPSSNSDQLVMMAWSASVRKILHVGRWDYGPLVMTDQVQGVRLRTIIPAKGASLVLNAWC